MGCPGASPLRQLRIGQIPATPRVRSRSGRRPSARPEPAAWLRAPRAHSAPPAGSGPGRICGRSTALALSQWAGVLRGWPRPGRAALRLPNRRRGCDSRSARGARCPGVTLGGADPAGRPAKEALWEQLKEQHNVRAARAAAGGAGPRTRSCGPTEMGDHLGDGEGRPGGGPHPGGAQRRDAGSPVSQSMRAQTRARTPG